MAPGTINMASGTLPDTIQRCVEVLPHQPDVPAPYADFPRPDGNDPIRPGQASVMPRTDGESTTLGLIELLLKNQHRLNQVSRSPQLQRELIPRLLMIGLVGYTMFGISLAIIFNAAQVWPELASPAEWLETRNGSMIRFASDVTAARWTRWLDGSAWHVVAAFTLGMVGAIGVCLPSFYFYGLLAGVRTTMLQVTTHALTGLASSAVALVGTLPVYFAAVLGLLVFDATDRLVTAVCFLGLALPFITGLYGTRALYIGFVGLTDTMPPDRRCRRLCFLRRLLFAWSVCFTSVTPVMIFTVWHYLSS